MEMTVGGGGHALPLGKALGKVIAAAEAQALGDVADAEIGGGQQGFGLLKAAPEQILHGTDPVGLFEFPDQAVFVQADLPGKKFDAQLVGKVIFNVLLDPADTGTFGFRLPQFMGNSVIEGVGFPDPSDQEQKQLQGMYAGVLISGQFVFGFIQEGCGKLGNILGF